MNLLAKCNDDDDDDLDVHPQPYSEAQRTVLLKSQLSPPWQGVHPWQWCPALKGVTPLQVPSPPEPGPGSQTRRRRVGVMILEVTLPKTCSLNARQDWLSLCPHELCIRAADLFNLLLGSRCGSTAS